MRLAAWQRKAGLHPRVELAVDFVNVRVHQGRIQFAVGDGDQQVLDADAVLGSPLQIGESIPGLFPVVPS